jgi:flagellar basal body-associated protein FliL
MRTEDKVLIAIVVALLLVGIAVAAMMFTNASTPHAAPGYGMQH